MEGLDHIKNVRLKLLIEPEQTILGRIGSCIVGVFDSITPLKTELKVIKS